MRTITVIALSAAMLACTTPGRPGPEAAGPAVIYAAMDLILQSKPAGGNPIHPGGYVTEGTKLTIIGEEYTLFHVRLDDGRTGWVAVAYVTHVPPPP